MVFETDSNDALIERQKHLRAEVERGKRSFGGPDVSHSSYMARLQLSQVEDEVKKRGLDVEKIPASVQDLAAENQKSSRKPSP